MPGSRRQNLNIEEFVRENARHVEENPNAVNKPHKCKDCGKEYDNFQALGGHRASHVKTKNLETHNSEVSQVKLHECRICKRGFAAGQALGGHMRKHWVGKVKEEKVIRHENENKNLENERIQETSIVSSQQPHDSCSSSSSLVTTVANGKEVFRYDLNLTPEENELMDDV